MKASKVRLQNTLLLTLLTFSALAMVASPAAAATPGAHPYLSSWRATQPEASDFLTPAGAQAGGRADTTWFGSYTIIAGEYHALSSSNKQSVMWTFDRGIGPHGDPARIEDGEGWRSVDMTANHRTWWRIADANLDLGDGVSPPIITGGKSLWIGADDLQSDSLCWSGGAGYGNSWCQQISTPSLNYNGSGAVTLSFKYFNDSEPCFDGTQVYLERADGSRKLLNPYDGTDCVQDPWTGGFTGAIGSYDGPATYARVVTTEEIGGAQSIRFVFEFTSDGGWSDEDGEFLTTRGPFGADDVTINGGGIDVAQDFENGLAPWTASVCPGVGSYAGIAPFACYDYVDPCECRLSGNILEMHDGVCPTGSHPDGQHERIESPICDIGTGARHDIFFDFHMFAQMPYEDGVLYRILWKYYPWTCPQHQIVEWSPPVGNNASYQWTGEDQGCYRMRYSATGGSPEAVPATAQKVIAIVDVIHDCSAFSIDPCSGTSNASPLFDNLAVGVTAAPGGPVVSFDTGGVFQDVGSYPNTAFDPRGTGPANVVFDRNLGQSGRPYLCGDSLVVTGPAPLGNDPNTRWEARLWWRVARRAVFNSDRESGVVSRYKVWKDQVSDGHAIDRPYRPEFTFGWMDSAQNGTVVYRNRFMSSFREGDDDFVGESNPQNEMLWDDVFYPGTRIEYFVTANYTNTPSMLYFLPDTTGGNFLEFEVLPGLMTADVAGCGGAGHNTCVFLPSTLYIDACNRGAQPYIEGALAMILNGQEPCQHGVAYKIPADRLWDRYDYLDASASWAAPFARGAIAGSNNGMTLQQILGYRTILFNTGDSPAGSTDDSDYELFQSWLTTPLCDSNLNRQALFMNGDNIGEIMKDFDAHGRPLLEDMLGAVIYCDMFNGHSVDYDCGEINNSYCVRYLPGELVPYGQDLAVDLYGSGCPDLFGFDVFYPTGSAIGSRVYWSEDGLKQMEFGQIVNQNLSADANFRSVVDGVSWHHMTERNAAGQGDDRCPRDPCSISSGIAAELAPALRWIYGVPGNDWIPKLTNAKSLSVCQSTWSFSADVDDGADLRVNRLWQNDPNPFNPRTTIKYSTARDGKVKVVVFDVSGRIVRTLVDGREVAGTHAVVWDGTNDRGAHVGSGVYWVQMRAGTFVSNKKMVVLK